ncbi:MAG: SPOR domain-containing protein [Nitrospinae bacterium]|nr:SPOR domain-containing protein [Nitrospinota bacterium]
MAPLATHALSLGKIRVTGSTTNQFKAEIPVQSDGKGGLVVSLGSEADYRRLRLVRPQFLDNLHIQVADHPSNPGQKIIYITSPDPIYQPSFNLIVKAFMSGGQIMESYFLALDFQKNLSLEMASGKDEDKAGVQRAASGLEAGSEAGSSAELDKIRLEEMEASRREDRIRSALKGEQPAAQTPPAAAEPKQPASKPEPAVKAESTAMADIKSSEESASARQYITSTEQPAPQAAPAKSEEPIEIVIKGDETQVKKPSGEVVTSVEPSPAPSKPVAVEGGSYTVAGGDTMFKVAHKIGVSQVGVNKYVVALWKKNKKSFIRGNIHGLKKDAKLDYTGVEEEAESISNHEANKALNEQWSEWKAIGLVKIAAAAKPKEPEKKEKKPASEVHAAVPAQKPAGQPKPVKTETPAAPPSPANGVMKTLAAWKKSAGLTKDGDVVDIVGIKTVDGGAIEVKIVKRTGKGAFQSTLSLKGESGSFKVEKEEEAAVKTKPAQAKPARGRPYTVHVASFKDSDSAKGMAQFLRGKGYNAYDITSFVPGAGGLYRVAVDRFASYAEAKEFSGKLVEAKIARSGKILKLPYAASVGGYKSGEEAAKKTGELSSKGYSAYTVQEAAGGASVMIGAFDSESAASEAAEKLASNDFSLSVVQP